MLYIEIIAVCSEIHTKHINTVCGLNVGFLGSFPKLQKAIFIFAMSVCPYTCNNSTPTGRIFTKLALFDNLSRKSKFLWIMTRIVGTLHVHLILSRSVLPRMRNVVDDNCRDEHNIHFLYSNFFSENLVICGTIFKNMMWFWLCIFDNMWK
jgi:hypothetical protein